MISPVEWAFWLGLTLIVLGPYLSIEASTSGLKILGHALTGIALVCIVLSSAEILFHVHIELGQSWPWDRQIKLALGLIVEGALVGWTYLMPDRRNLCINLLEQAEEIIQFSARTKDAQPEASMEAGSISSLLQWRRIARAYYQDHGQRALRLLKRSCDPRLKTKRAIIEYPRKYGDFLEIAIFLRVVAVALPKYRRRRVVKNVGLGMLSGALLFVIFWALRLAFADA